MASVGLPYVSNVPNMGGGLSLSNDAPNFAYNVNTATQGVNLLSRLIDLRNSNNETRVKARIETTGAAINKFETLADLYDKELPDYQYNKEFRGLINSAKERLDGHRNNLTDPGKDDALQKELARLKSIGMDPDPTEAIRDIRREQANLDRITRQNKLRTAQATPIKQEVEGRLALSKLGQAQPEDRSQAELMSRVISPMGAGNAAIPARPRTREEIGRTVQNVPPALLAGLSLGNGQGKSSKNAPASQKETTISGQNEAAKVIYENLSDDEKKILSSTQVGNKSKNFDTTYQVVKNRILDNDMLENVVGEKIAKKFLSDPDSLTKEEISIFNNRVKKFTNKFVSYSKYQARKSTQSDLLQTLISGSGSLNTGRDTGGL